MPEPFAWNHCPICGQLLIVAHDGQSEVPHCPPCRRFYYRNPVPAACAFLRRGSDELLFTRRAVDPAKGEWSLPGGFMEIGETPEETVLREIQEETGLEARNPKLLGIRSKPSPVSGSIMVVGFVIEDWEGEPRPDTDALELGFFSRSARPRLAFSVHRELLALYDARYP
ncbi:MAG TPA: NUDIX hydrolase [Candidatus Hydrogenedentes bacterium]|nr:NUDIX hydrolase [Candidatus Hydrogenedentota bacterium]